MVESNDPKPPADNMVNVNSRCNRLGFVGRAVPFTSVRRMRALAL
jgi:hypothetical protein